MKPNVMPFKEGDKVVCTHVSDDFTHHFTVGNVYTISACQYFDKLDHVYVGITEVNKGTVGWHAENFEKVEDNEVFKTTLRENKRMLEV